MIHITRLSVKVSVIDWAADSMMTTSLHCQDLSAQSQLSGPEFATKPRAELASTDKTQHIWLALRALRTHLRKTTAGHDGADCGDLLSRPGTKHSQPGSRRQKQSKINGLLMMI